MNKFINRKFAAFLIGLGIFLIVAGFTAVGIAYMQAFDKVDCINNGQVCNVEAQLRITNVGSVAAYVGLAVTSIGVIDLAYASKRKPKA
jgi:hypothetical protein